MPLDMKNIFMNPLSHELLLKKICQYSFEYEEYKGSNKGGEEDATIEL